MRSINWLFWPLLTVFVFIGCAPPIGYISGGTGSAGDDELLAVPYRIVYDVRDFFRRSSDVAIFTSYKGLVQSIPVKNVKISIIEDPTSPDNTPIEIPKDEDYPLEHFGRKIIIIEYNGLEARYSIEVQDPYGISPDSPDNGNVEMGGGGIIWVY